MCLLNLLVWMFPSPPSLSLFFFFALFCPSFLNFFPFILRIRRSEWYIAKRGLLKLDTGTCWVKTVTHDWYEPQLIPGHREARTVGGREAGWRSIGRWMAGNNSELSFWPLHLRKLLSRVLTDKIKGERLVSELLWGTKLSLNLLFLSTVVTHIFSRTTASFLSSPS